MNFGDALKEVKGGGRVAREGWNGKDMFIFLVGGSTFKVNRAPLLGIYPEGAEVTYHAHIDMKTAQGYVVPWLASQADLLAEDWVVCSAAPALPRNRPLTERLAASGGIVQRGDAQASDTHQHYSA